MQGQRSHIASYNGLSPLNILGETSSPRKAEGAAGPLPRGSLTAGLSNHCSSEPRLQKIKSLKGERQVKMTECCKNPLLSWDVHIHPQQRNGQEGWSFPWERTGTQMGGLQHQNSYQNIQKQLCYSNVSTAIL